jgi:RES domain
MAWDQMTALKRSRIRRKTHRLIASKSTVGVFDDLTSDPSDVRAAFILEALTNDRLAAQRINLLPDKEIIVGPVDSGASIVMAAFLHADEAGGRFTDGRLGGWYAAFELETAIAETIHHNARRLRLSAGGFPNRIQIRELIVTIKADLVDVRGLQKDRPELYRDADYSASQAIASEFRWPKSPENGVVFDSVRRKSGTNVCIFWPSKVPLPVVQGDHFEYQWDASGHPTVMKLTNIEL